MALITQYSDANKQELEPVSTYSIWVGSHALQGVWCNIYNDITTGRYVYTGMDRTAAMACVTAVQDPSNGINASCRWVAGRLYEVDVSIYQVTTRQVPIGE